MTNLLLGTNDGVFRVAADTGKVSHEQGPPSVAFMARDAKRHYAITREGNRDAPRTLRPCHGSLWAENDAGQWELVSQNPVEEEIWSFGADPKLEGRLYLGIAPALLYISKDGGKTWKKCESVKNIEGYENWTFPVPPHTPHVRSIVADPLEPGAVYMGVEEGGIFRSADEGETWDSLNEGLFWDVHTVTPAANSDTIYAATGSGFHRSLDRGRQWRHVVAGLDRTYQHPLVESKKHPGRLYSAAAFGSPAGWADGANAAIYRSDDNGNRWTQLEGGLPPRFDDMIYCLKVDDEEVVYAATENQILTSRDEGANWEVMAEGLPHIRSMLVV